MFEKERRQKFEVKHGIPLVRVLTAMDNNTLLRGTVACVQTSPHPSGKNRERRHRRKSGRKFEDTDRAFGEF